MNYRQPGPRQALYIQKKQGVCEPSFPKCKVGMKAVSLTYPPEIIKPLERHFAGWTEKALMKQEIKERIG